VWRLLLALPLLAAPAGAAGEAARRVVSMNPSLTETLLALGAADRLVGVDEDSARRLAPARGLPTVGGLFNPSLEAILALEPDLVVMVPSAQQRGLGERLGELGVPVLELPNITLEELLASVEALGARVGRPGAAAARIRAIRSAWAEISHQTAARPPLRTVAVLQREPLYVVGPGSWIDSMLAAAGARNLGAELGEPFPQAAEEWLIAAAPDLLLDATEDPGREPLEYWSRWPSLPAVASGRVVRLDEEWIRPGPYLDRALRALAAAIEAAAGPP